MSYTVTPKLINIEDWSEQDVNPWTQDTAKDKIARPNAVNPEYLLIYTSSEVIILDKYGNKVLQKTFDYTINEARINNNGDFIIRSGDTVYIYDINGNLLYQNTYATTINKVDIGLNYAWVSLLNDPRDIYVINLSDFSYTNFTVDLTGNFNYPVRCSETGERAVITSGDTSNPAYVIFMTKDGIEKSVSLGVNGYPTTLKLRPDGVIAFTDPVQSNGPVRVFAVRNDGAKAQLGSISVYKHAAIAVSVNGDKIAFIGANQTTIYKRLLDIDMMEVSDAGTITLPEAIDSVVSPDTCLDMTPDGKYIIAPSGSKIRIIDWGTNTVKKEITKSITYKYYAVLTVEAT